MKSLFLIIIAVGLFTVPHESGGHVIEFIPALQIAGEYADNIFLSKTDKEHDYITTVSPGFVSRLAGKYGAAQLQYQFGFVRYEKHDMGNTLRHDARLLADYAVSGQTKLTLQNSFRRTETPYAQDDGITDDQTDASVRKGREPFNTNAASVQIDHRFGKTGVIQIRYDDTFLKNDDPAVEDSAGHGGAVGIKSDIFPPRLGFESRISYMRGEFSGLSDNFDKWGAFVKLSHRFSKSFESFISYERTLTDYAGDKENNEVSGVSAGVTRSLSQSLSAGAGAGWYWDRKETERQAGFSGNVHVKADFKDYSVQINGSTGYDESFFSAENLGYSKFGQFGCSAKYQLSKTAAADVRGTYREDRFTDTDDSRKDKKLTAASGLDFQIRPWLKFKMEYQYRRVESSVVENEYDENRIGFQFLMTGNPFRKLF